MPTTICVINQKGGSGKSSTCFHLAGAFAQGGLQVLLLDADPQGSLSQGFFGSTEVENLLSEQTLAALFDDGHFLSTAGSLLLPTPFQGITLLPANHTLTQHNVPSPETAGMTQHALRSFLSELKGFDLVLIDCPPNLYQCSWNAMLAAHFVVVPVPPEDFGTQGLRIVHQAVDNARKLNPGLKLLGHLVTRCDWRLLIHRSYEQKLRQHYGAQVLTTVIPEASAFKVALACRQPVSYYAPRSKAAHLTGKLGCEILHRISEETDEQHTGKGWQVLEKHWKPSTEMLKTRWEFDWRTPDRV